jgi:hypothetical protein
MESIIRWRISPSRESSSAIPPPFSPTPLQAYGPGHNIAIDCCTWPSIRDQLILHHASYDMDELSRVMIRHTVIEVSYLKSSVCILDLFVNSILPEENDFGSSQDLDPTSRLYAINDVHSTDNAARTIDPNLLNEICRRMSHRIPLDVHLGQMPQRSHLSEKFGLSDFTKWKLSKDFASKYPFLDCSSGKHSSSAMISLVFTNDDLKSRIQISYR